MPVVLPAIAQKALAQGYTALAAAAHQGQLANHFVEEGPC